MHDFGWYRAIFLVSLAVILKAGPLAAQPNDLMEVGSIAEFRAKAPPQPEGWKRGFSVNGRTARRLNQTEIECWMAYLIKRRECRIAARPNEAFSVAGPLVPDFEEEYEARSELRNKLNEHKEQLGRSQTRYLAVLNQVAEAGFLADYVFQYHHQDHWDGYNGRIPLNPDAFRDWAADSLAEHQIPEFGSLSVQPVNAANAVGILIEKSLESPVDGAVWLRYALMRYEYLRRHGSPLVLLVGEELRPTFEEELEARRAVYSGDWQRTREGLSGETAGTFDAMFKADEAGFAKEFVWTCCQQPGWQMPEGLQLEAFQTWAKDHIPDHLAQAPAHAILIGRKQPAAQRADEQEEDQADSASD